MINPTQWPYEARKIYQWIFNSRISKVAITIAVDKDKNVKVYLPWCRDIVTVLPDQRIHIEIAQFGTPIEVAMQLDAWREAIFK